MLAWACALSAAAVSASAATFFDSQALSATAQGELEINHSATQSSDFNYAAEFAFSANTNVSTIGVYTSINNPQSVKLLIFNASING